MEEIWKDIPGYEGIYQCSNLGSIKSLERYVKHSNGGLRIVNDRILKQNITLCGYKYIWLHNDGSRKSCRIHKLVAICFFNHKPDGYLVCVDHIDGNKLNNRVDNLRLVSSRENASFDNRKNFNNLTSKYVGVHKASKDKKYTSRIRFNKVSYHLGYFTNEKDASNKYQEALEQINIGKFLEWFEQDKLIRIKKYNK